eukprot:CAMPEP_0115864406 /NCGR_PEP_ID=MMETSP0287-20121206/19186_1 /TAXON_ID=412157 /ORGANISM="Chrysochromulina rotalis, Strain UIO044" /LENGTH=310 /DNA_ID=CAMNT_0003318879 /DNA_START=17 /DNA_END=949 /DNA_ORIENTATION=+
MATVVLVVPCYQAERWLRREGDPQMDVRLLFVHECLSITDSAPRKINRWLDRIAYSAPSRAQPGRVRIMHLRKRFGRAEVLRRAIIEALEWPEHLGGKPNYICLWPAEFAPLASCTDVASLALTLEAKSGEFLLVTGDSTDKSTQTSPALNTLACLALGIPTTKHTTLSNRSALFLRATPTLYAAVATRFRTPRLFQCELLARYKALHAGDPHGLVQPLVLEACAHKGWAFSDGHSEGGRNQDGVDIHGKAYDTASTSMLRILHSLLMIRILYFSLDWPSGSIRPQTVWVLGVAIWQVAVLSGVLMTVLG